METVKCLEGSPEDALNASWEAGDLNCVLCESPTMQRGKCDIEAGLLKGVLVYPICERHSPTPETLKRVKERLTQLAGEASCEAWGDDN